VLLCTISHILDICIEYKEVAESPLPEVICDIGKIESFEGMEDFAPLDRQGSCMMGAALCVWNYNRHKYASYIKNITGIYEKYSDKKWFTGVSSIFKVAIESTFKVKGEDSAKKLLKEVLGNFASEQQRHIADHLVSCCLCDTSTEQPMQHYQIWRHAIKPDREVIINSMLPYCHDDTAVEANLRLAIHHGYNSPVGKKALEKALDLSLTEKPGMYLDFEKDLWTMYSATHGNRGCIEAVMKMLLQNDQRNVNIAGVITAAIENIEKPGEILHKLWERINELEVHNR
jgi:hypothetical protein